jgi:hypothetical protein
MSKRQSRKTTRKTKSRASPVQFRVHRPKLQIDFWARLQQVRPQFLRDAIDHASASFDPVAVDKELAQFVERSLLQKIREAGIRGEVFFPVPIVLRSRPQLLGYYRLLYGISQKEFYQTPFGLFRLMEEKNRLSERAEPLLPALCHSLIATASQLLVAIQPISESTLHDLQMLTLGPQFRGSQNVNIGQGATRKVFDLIRSLVSEHIQTSTENVLSVKNAAGRSVQIAFAADPDITIIEQLPSSALRHTSIEIKGGSDVSNVHNRLGEAEKSHLNAKESGFTRFWTILKAPVSAQNAKAESPTTQCFFGLDEILNEASVEHVRFKELLFQTLGIA